jgi:TrmH family RNA methyltransferase
MEIITSRANNLVKSTKKLLQKKYRKQAKAYLLEGHHLVSEAQTAGSKITKLFVTEDEVSRYPDAIVVSPEVMREMTDSQTPQGVLAIVDMPETTSLSGLSRGRYLVLDQVQDPGNVGTMIRTADAAGYDGVVVSNDSADIYSPKVMRSMQGSNFHLPIFMGSQEEIYQAVHELGMTIYATTLSDMSVSHTSIAYPPAFALVMGNEGNGITATTQAMADQFVHIDMPGKAESLNVGVAAGIMMFETIRKG